jgi:hypothetical protein
MITGAAVLINLRKVRGDDPLQHSLRVFAVYDRRGAPFGSTFAHDNFELQQACQRFRERVRGQSLLVVGGHNQAYLQLEAAFDTPVVSVCELAAAVAGELRDFLPGPPQQNAPEYILDTIQALPESRFGLEWLLDYHQVDSCGRIRLYQRNPGRAPT